VRPDNGLYFTDPLTNGPLETRADGAERRARLFSSRNDRKTFTRVTTTLSSPTESLGRQTETPLRFQTSGRARLTRRYPPGRSPREQTSLCELGSDGMTDRQPGECLSHRKGVTVFDRKERRSSTSNIETMDRKCLLRRARSQNALHHARAKASIPCARQVKGITK